MIAPPLWAPTASAHQAKPPASRLHARHAGRSPAGAVQAGPRPIIFIPGVLGSYLQDASGAETWPQVQALSDCGLVSPKPGCVPSVLAADALTPTGIPLPGSTVAQTDGAPGPPLGGALSVTSAKYCIPLGIFGCLTVQNTINHWYDITAQNAANSGYVIVQPSDNAGLQACSATWKCFIPVGIDWRLSAVTNASQVLAVIDNVIAQTQTDRVDIVAHSQGGLVANAIVHLQASVGKINRIVTLGTPFLGAPKVLAELLYGVPCQIPTPLHCLIDGPVVQALIENYPGTADLSPSPGYYSASPSPSALFSGVGNMSYAQAHQLIAQILANPPQGGQSDPQCSVSSACGLKVGDTSLLDQAASFHQQTDLWQPLDPAVQLLRMVGYDAGNGSGCVAVPCSGAAQLGAYSWNGTIVGVDTDPLQHLPPSAFGSGDGTVPLYSASLYNPAAGFDDRGAGTADMFWCAISHFGLAQSTTVWQSAVAYLEGAPLVGDVYGSLCPDGTFGSLAGLGLLDSTTSLATPTNPSSLGFPVQLAATVYPYSATGSVTFKDGPNVLGTAALTNGQASLTTALLTTGSHPISAVYSGNGTVVASSSSVVNQVVERPVGGYSLDGFGGVHPLGSSSPLPTSGSWPGWNIARGMALNAGGTGGYVLDAFGGLHPFGDAPSVSVSAYWGGWDIARAVHLRPDGVSGWVLDGWGGLHEFGGAPAVSPSAYWAGWDIARDFAIAADGRSGWVLDGWGNLHPFGGASPVTITGYWPGWDIAHRLAINPDGQSGYVLDGFGGVHAFGVAGHLPPSLALTAYWSGWDIARDVVMLPSGGGGYVMDGYGGIHPFGAAPWLVTSAGGYTPGQDVWRALALA